MTLPRTSSLAQEKLDIVRGQGFLYALKHPRSVALAWACLGKNWWWWFR